MERNWGRRNAFASTSKQKHIYERSNCILTSKCEGLISFLISANPIRRISVYVIVTEANGGRKCFAKKDGRQLARICIQMQSKQQKWQMTTWHLLKANKRCELNESNRLLFANARYSSSQKAGKRKKLQTDGKIIFPPLSPLIEQRKFSVITFITRLLWLRLCVVWRSWRLICAATATLTGVNNEAEN